MKDNSLLELFLGLLFLMFLLYFNNRNKNKSNNGKGLLVQMYSNRVNIAGIFGIIFIIITIARKLYL